MSDHGVRNVPFVVRALMVILGAEIAIMRLPSGWERGPIVVGALAIAAVTTSVVYLWVIRPLIRKMTGARSRAGARQKVLENQLRHAQRLEAVGRLTAGVAHDFNNALTVILGNAESLIQHASPDDPGHREQLDEIGTSAQRAAELARQLVNHSRRAEFQPEPVDLAQIVRSLLPAVRALLSEEIDVEVTSAPNLPHVLADRLSIEQILLNLTTNARDAMPEAGRLHIELAHERRSTGTADGCRKARMVVSDTGVGMDSTTKARVFEPFFTTKPPGVGTGLGMAMIAQLVKEHGGGVRIASERGRGTRVEVSLPLASEHQVQEQVRRRAGRGPLGEGPRAVLGTPRRLLRGDSAPPAA